jgi:hypothetical protein
MPPLQLWPGWQTLPQVPQLLVFVLVLVSQPSARLLLLQSAHPVWHVPTSHCNVGWQDGVMWLDEQGCPHPGQLATVKTAVSQPSERLLRLQSPNPVWQVPVSHCKVQWFAGAQTGSMWLDEQASPHPPQLATLVAILVSQPSFPPLQFAQSTSQAPVQLPAGQVGAGR